jgi:hypothetical protein
MRQELGAADQAQIKVIVSANGVVDQDAMLATLCWRNHAREKK